MKKDFSVLREEMVQKQLILRGIRDPRLLQSFRKVPRHKFVLEKYLESAYEDSPLPIGEGQTISQPYMVALMTECLQLRGEEAVLEIGTGSGYQAAILAQLTAQVYSVERVASLAQRAERIVKDLGYRNIQIKVADGTTGWQEHAPYDGIIVTAGAPAIPQPLIEQLSEGGKLLIPIGGTFSQILTEVIKRKDRVEVRKTCGCVFVPLVGKYAWRKENV